jgi:hypothetical protein
MQRVVREQYAYVADIGQVVLVAREVVRVEKLAQIMKEPVLPFQLQDFETTIVNKLATVLDATHNERLQSLLQDVRSYNESKNTQFEHLKYAPSLPMSNQ